MIQLPPEDVDVIRIAARELKRKMDELYGKELESYREEHTQRVISNLVEKAERRYLEEEGPVPEDEFEEMRGELKRVVAQVVAEEFGVTVKL
jgi:hypothetical protein